MSKGQIVAIVAGAFVGLSLGASFGWKLAADYSGVWSSQEVHSAQSQLALSSALNCSYADIAHGRAAVLLEIRTLKNLQQAQPDFDGHSFIGVAFVRLAMLEQRAGRQNEMETALTEARSYYGSKREAASDSELENSVKVIDAKLYHLP